MAVAHDAELLYQLRERSGVRAQVVVHGVPYVVVNAVPDFLWTLGQIHSFSVGHFWKQLRFESTSPTLSDVSTPRDFHFLVFRFRPVHGAGEWKDTRRLRNKVVADAFDGERREKFLRLRSTFLANGKRLFVHCH